MNPDGTGPAPSIHSSVNVPRTMRAVLLREFGGPELLNLEEVSAPDPLAQSEGGFGMRAMAAPMTSSISPGESKLRLAVIAKFSIE